MRPHDVDHRFTSKFGEVVRADDHVVVATPHIIHTRFKLNELVYARSIFNRPVHTAANATEREVSLNVAAGQLLEHL